MAKQAQGGEGLSAQVGILLSQVESELEGCREVKRALEGLSKPGALASAALSQKHLSKLREVSLLDAGLCAGRDALVAALEGGLERQHRVERMRLLGELRGAATASGLELVRLGESPPTFLLSPLTVVVDFEVGKARWCYARETLLTTPMEVSAILEGRLTAMAQVRAEALESEAFFTALHQAYRMVLALQGRGEGERVDLVDLLVPLGALREGVSAWRKASRVEVFPRYLLAYQLHRLRRDNLLERDGVRVDLGTATGGSTRDKRDVLFVPTTATEGQYYLSMRMEARG